MTQPQNAILILKGLITFESISIEWVCVFDYMMANIKHSRVAKVEDFNLIFAFAQQVSAIHTVEHSKRTGASKRLP